VLNAPTNLIVACDLGDPLENFQGLKPLENILGESESSVKACPKSIACSDFAVLDSDATEFSIKHATGSWEYRQVVDLTKAILEGRFHKRSPIWKGCVMKVSAIED
jgi:hypothetical protein